MSTSTAALLAGQVSPNGPVTGVAAVQKLGERQRKAAPEEAVARSGVVHGRSWIHEPVGSWVMRGHQSRATARATGSLSTGCQPRW